MALTISEMNKLATLARLRFSEEEFEQFMDDMDEIIEFADTINQSVAGSTGDIKDVGAVVVGMDMLRDDEVTESLPSEKILSNVEGDNGYFVVKKVVGKGNA